MSIAFGLFALLVISLEIGYQIGRRGRGAGDSAGAGQVGAIQGAILGLLGLLLAFSFAAAGGRFLERQDLITAEANAIGTSTLRADLLAEPHRTALRDALHQYTERRLAISPNLRHGMQPSDLAEFDRMLGEIWRAAIAGVNDRPQTMIGVLPPVNDVIDLHTLRWAAARKQLPWLVKGVLLFCSVVAMGVIGYGSGLAGSRRPLLAIALTIVVGSSLWLTYDLDHPRAGLLQLSDAPLKALRFNDATD